MSIHTHTSIVIVIITCIKLYMLIIIYMEKKAVKVVHSHDVMFVETKR